MDEEAKSGQQENRRQRSSPARRLHTLLVAYTQEKDEAAKVCDVLLKATGLAARRGGDGEQTLFRAQPELSHLYGDIHETFRAAVAAVRVASQEHANHFLNPWAGSVQKLIAVDSAHVQWSQAKHWVEPHVLTALDLTARHLEMVGPADYLLSDQELQQLLEAANDLALAIREAELPKPLKQRLLNQTLNIRRALELYRFFGNEVIEHALAVAIGSSFLRADEMKAAREHANTRDIINKYGGLLWKVAQALANTSSIAQLPAVVEQLLLGS